MEFVKRCFSDRHKVLAWLGLVAVLLLTAVVVTPSIANADDGGEDAMYSMYKSASFAASYFDQHRLNVAQASAQSGTSGGGSSTGSTGGTTGGSTGGASGTGSSSGSGGSGGNAGSGSQSQPTGNGGDKDWKDVNLKWTQAGGLLGFVDPDYGTFFMGFFSQLTGAESTFSYKALAGTESDTTAHYEPFRAYVMYGHALKQIGVDETASAGIFDIGGMLGRLFLGVLLYFSYMLCSVSDFAFWALVQLLKNLNPFAWFSAGISGFVNPTGSTTWDTSVFKEMFKSVYDGIVGSGTAGGVSLRTVIIGLMLVFLVVSILWKASHQESSGISAKVANFIFKMCFFFFAIPVCGSLYTNVLNYLSNELGMMNGPSEKLWSNPTNILMSTVVDFKAWAETTNLALPSGVVIKTDDDGNLDLQNSTAPKTVARKINEQSYNAILDSTNNTWASQMNFGNELILALMSNADYSEAAYETQFKSALDGSNLNKSHGAINSGGYDLNDMQEDMKETSKADVYTTKAVISGDDENADGELAFQYFRGIGGPVSTMTATSSDNLLDFEFSNKTTTTQPSLSSGLSPMSMFNYLASDFKDDTVSIYSSHKITSGIARTTHKAVNVVGESVIHKTLNALVAATEMLAIGIIGLGYGFGMLIGGIKTSFKLLVSVPLAMLGVFRFMIRVLVCFIALLGEVIITIFLYSIVSQLLMMINEGFTVEFFTNLVGSISSAGANAIQRGWMYDASTNSFVTATINWAAPASGVLSNVPVVAGSNSLLDALGAIFLIVFNLVFGFMALFLRRPLVKQVTSVMEESLAGILMRTAGGAAVGSAAGRQGVAGSLNGNSNGRNSSGDIAQGATAAAAGLPMVPTTVGGALGTALGRNAAQMVANTGDSKKADQFQKAATLAAGAASGPGGVFAAQMLNMSNDMLSRQAANQNGTPITPGSTPRFEDGSQDGAAKLLTASAPASLEAGSDSPVNEVGVEAKTPSPEDGVNETNVGNDDNSKLDADTEAKAGHEQKGAKATLDGKDEDLVGGPPVANGKGMETGLKPAAASVDSSDSLTVDGDSVNAQASGGNGSSNSNVNATAHGESADSNVNATAQADGVEIDGEVTPDQQGRYEGHGESGAQTTANENGAEVTGKGTLTPASATLAGESTSDTDKTANQEPVADIRNPEASESENKDGEQNANPKNAVSPNSNEEGYTVSNGGNRSSRPRSTVSPAQVSGVTVVPGRKGQATHGGSGRVRVTERKYSKPTYQGQMNGSGRAYVTGERKVPSLFQPTFSSTVPAEDSGTPMTSSQETGSRGLVEDTNYDVHSVN